MVGVFVAFIRVVYGRLIYMSLPKHGTIERKHELPRSYVVKTPGGRKYRRNRKHLCPTKSVPIRTEPEEIVVQLPDIQPKTTSNGHTNTNNRSAEPFESPLSQQPEQQTARPPEFVEKSPYKTRSGRISKPPNRYSSV